MTTIGEAGMWRDIGAATQALRGIESLLEELVRQADRVAGALEHANELAELVQEVGEHPDT